jgi:hypothetical protein
MYKSEQGVPFEVSTIECWIASKTISAKRRCGLMGASRSSPFFLISVAFVATDRRKHMSKKAAEHHHKAAEHHEHAARHHKEAAKHHEAGKHETAAHHAHLARGHHEHAKHHAAEAAKAHIEEHGKAIPAHA